MMRRASVLFLAVSLSALSGLAMRASAAGSGTINGTVHVDPLATSISIARVELKTGQNGRVTAGVTNRGSGAVLSVRLEIVAPAGLALVPGALFVATLSGGATRSASWTICGAQPGNHVIVARATAVDSAGNGLLAESLGVVIEIEGRPKPCR